jgi:xanthine dehydrogenase accessory factor
LGWKVRVLADAGSAAGVIAALSPADKVVVAAHDLELAGSALLAALESAAGYIGSVGSRRMQENRADWLAYRGVTDLSRVHGPAGLDIGAETPGEIAVSVIAEAISVSARIGRIEAR